MGRKKRYDPREKLAQAMRLFRETGFSATTTEQLVKGLGINRKSMYAEFGNKEQLFEAALRLYNEVNVERNFAPLESERAGIAEIIALLERVAVEARGPAAGLGCLLCNTAGEGAPGPGSRDAVHNYVARIRSAFVNTLDRSRARGEASQSIDVALEADFLTSHIVGQFTLIRANVAPAVVEASFAAARRYVLTLST
jgi:TetR/AcrR family transcriptional repressor of nem operon